jgi:PAS domain S-box-containing protein
MAEAAPLQPDPNSRETDRPLLRLVGALRGSGAGVLDRLDDGDDRSHRQILDALGVAMYATDAAGHITYFNEAAVELWGRRPALGEEWCGSWRLFWPDGRPMRHDECPMAIALRENRAVRGWSAIAERPDGSRVVFQPFPTPLRDAAGRLVGAVNVLVDVTEQRRAQDALHATATELAVSNAVKDEFLGLVSHELRTPVTTIFGNADLLRSHGERLGSTDRASMVEDIAEESERLSRIIENLLLLSRLQAGSRPELEPQLLTHIVRKAIRTFADRNPGREVRLAFAPPQYLIVDADRTYLELLLENLLGNASKYSDPAAPIEVTMDLVDGDSVVRVLDRGIGIDPEVAGQVFMPFFRTEAAQRRAGGVGLGLAVCQRIVEALGGRIWAQPRDGGGSEFGFALPPALELEDAG